MTGANDLADAVSRYGDAAKRKLASKAASGGKEAQLAGPIEALIKGLAELSGIPADAVTLVLEANLSDLRLRPDFAVDVHNALIGFIELKAPGKGADPRHFTDDHDKKQWVKLKSLPNLLYTDGNGFSVWRNGELAGKVVQLDGDLEKAGAALTAPTGLLALLHDFLTWTPTPPRTPKQLAETSARLCRLLRDEVAEELERNNPGLTLLAKEWRNLLFPDASPEQFADGYAQAVTFGLLMARVRNIKLGKGHDFEKTLDAAAAELSHTNTLIGSALRLLVDNKSTKKALQTSLGTLCRVLNEVDWPTVAKGKPDAWLYFYEDFLEVYDNRLRKLTGSYYTPPEVVTAMVRLTDEALRDPALFDLREGMAATKVSICDPAIGTGTFVLGVLRQIAATVEQDQGAGAVGPALEAALQRILGFELQFGPFAVAQLRLIAEMQRLTGQFLAPTPQLYVTDTLGDPYAAESQFSALVKEIGESRKQANRIKRETPITVVIGNPPYKNDADGLGGWIERGSKGREAPMDLWDPPVDWGVSAHAKHLKNLYVFFWRWATWKVFGSGWQASTGHQGDDRSGIVCFITASGFLNGPGFEKMRDDLRRDCTSIWVIDCSPEGFRPAVSSRIFPGVKHRICIVLAARTLSKDRSVPARLRYRALPEGHRSRVKFAALETLTLQDQDWIEGAAGWREPFLPEQDAAWGSFLSLAEMFAWAGPGVKTHRTWVIAPDVTSLQERWFALQNEGDRARKDVLFHPDRDRTLSRTVSVRDGASHVHGALSEGPRAPRPAPAAHRRCRHL